MKDYYAVLGFSFNDRGTITIQALKKRYHALALQFHPDKQKEDTTDQMKKINEAYAILSDEKKREKYHSDYTDFKENYSKNLEAVMATLMLAANFYTCEQVPIKNKIYNLISNLISVEAERKLVHQLVNHITKIGDYELEILNLIFSIQKLIAIKFDKYLNKILKKLNENILTIEHLFQEDLKAEIQKHVNSLDSGDLSKFITWPEAFKGSPEMNVSNDNNHTNDKNAGGAASFFKMTTSCLRKISLLLDGFDSEEIKTELNQIEEILQEILTFASSLTKIVTDAEASSSQITNLITRVSLNKVTSKPNYISPSNFFNSKTHISSSFNKISFFDVCDEISQNEDRKVPIAIALEISEENIISVTETPAGNIEIHFSKEISQLDIHLIECKLKKANLKCFLFRKDETMHGYDELCIPVYSKEQFFIFIKEMHTKFVLRPSYCSAGLNYTSSFAF